MLPRKALAVATTALALFPIALAAQTAPPTQTLPLAGVYYRYWPEQIVQWVGPELPYLSLIHI